MTGPELLILLQTLFMGPKLEPLLHPKPGAVTRFLEHKDKNVIDFCEHTLLIEMAMARAFLVSKSETLKDPISEGLKEYLSALKMFKVKENIALGTALLHIPLAAALGDIAYPAEPLKLVKRASSLALGSKNGGKVYYEILELLHPSHLRKYEGPIPAVGKGYPKSLSEVLRSASWDHVHSELIRGYPLSIKAFLAIERNLKEKNGLEEAILKVLLKMLSENGDTLILAKYGIRAYQRAIEDSKIALFLSNKIGVRRALEELDRDWRAKGWNPGAILDIVSVGISLFYYNLVKKTLIY